MLSSSALQGVRMRKGPCLLLCIVGHGEDCSELGPGHNKCLSNPEQSAETRMQACERMRKALCSSCLSRRREGHSVSVLVQGSDCRRVHLVLLQKQASAKRRWGIRETDLDSPM